MINLKDVSFFYAGSESERGIRNINLSVGKGEVVLLCGESGCGKTTVTRLINGLIPHYYEGQMSGEVLIGEQKIHELPLHETSRLVGSVFQNPRSQFFSVSTTSEIAFGCENMALPVPEIFRRIDQTVREFKIESLMNRSIFKLSGGEKQKIACASVAACDPPILVLDEPSSNMDTDAVEELRRIIEIWKRKGKTIIIAEHRLYYLRELIDRVIYMKDGVIAGEYTARAFRALPPEKLTEMGLRPLSLSGIVRKYAAMPESNETMTLLGFSYSYKHAASTRAALNMKNFSIPRNAIIAIVGKNGAGKSTFARCLCGLEKNFGGTVEEENQALRSKQLLKKSYMVMQDVNHQLFTESVLDEVLLSMKNEQEASAGHILDSLDLLPLKELHPMSLSGGQKQRVAIAGAVGSEREIIIFDEPTSGLDIYHMKEVALNIERLKMQGKTVFVITHDLELVMECCNHVLHFENGKVIGNYPLNSEGCKKLRLFFGHIPASD
ncbi:energy-coupling factor transport system ATP-binding protein [Kineothrix alysoides]|uniref:Energy-coupling factor transport system ATP-binding protein n=1 Tax=Kineothrix alysoides TaxID=1469948 RepID=A0A4R1QTE0_9FIRM|nr:energy-coupling factor ABC transporter ATP-binding protein [Kineothrix alysoides]TCL57199.1 energy-coupling factor transport system ATP-binding protein [Kineothrix alysoides]